MCETSKFALKHNVKIKYNLRFRNLPRNVLYHYSDSCTTFNFRQGLVEELGLINERMERMDKLSKHFTRNRRFRERLWISFHPMHGRNILLGDI